jgi:hypothetical protein
VQMLWVYVAADRAVRRGHSDDLCGVMHPVHRV